MDNKVKLAWLIGIVEGEGCFSVAKGGKNRKHFVFAISITNTDLVLLSKCKEIIEEDMEIKVKIRKRNKVIKNRRARYDLVINSIERCIKFITIALPYLVGEKHQQAELMLQFLKRRKKIKDCGRKGHSACYTPEDDCYLESIRALKNITESVETITFPILNKDEDRVRATRINKGVELSRNDLTALSN